VTPAELERPEPVGEERIEATEAPAPEAEAETEPAAAAVAKGGEDE
jgi:hypothetical protein